MWLALAALFTVSALSACSDDDNNENGNVGGVTIDGVGQVEYFRLNLGVFSSNDSIVCPLMMTAADELTPTVYSYYVDDEDNVEDIFLSWIPEQARGAVSRDDSTIVYTPRDAQGAPQGTITFRTALPSETATLAVVELKGVSKMLGIDKIKFQPESAKADNGEPKLFFPRPLKLTSIKEGNWYWGKVPQEEIFSYHYDYGKMTYYYTYPVLKSVKESLFLFYPNSKGFYTHYGYTCFMRGMETNPEFKKEACKRLKEYNTDFFHGGGYYLPYYRYVYSYYSYSFNDKGDVVFKY